VRPRYRLLARMVERYGVEIVSAAASSKLALTWMSEAKCIVAGSHLEDPKTGEFNLPFIANNFPVRTSASLRCAVGERPVIAPGNPKQVRKIEDLARKNVKFVNREPGSGSAHCWIDFWGRGIDAQKVQGYDGSPTVICSGLLLIRGRPMSAWPPALPPRRRLGFIPAYRALRPGMRNEHGTCRRSKRFSMVCSERRSVASWKFWPVTYFADGDRHCVGGSHSRLRSHQSLRRDFDFHLPKGFSRRPFHPESDECG